MAKTACSRDSKLSLGNSREIHIFLTEDLEYHKKRD